MNRFGNVSLVCQRRTNRNICSNVIQCSGLINRCCGDSDHDIEAIWFIRRRRHCAILANSRSRYPGRFRTAVFVRAFDLGRPHAEAVIAGAVLGLAVLDLEQILFNPGHTRQP